MSQYLIANWTVIFYVWMDAMAIKKDNIRNGTPENVLRNILLVPVCTSSVLLFHNNTLRVHKIICVIEQNTVLAK